MKVHPAISLKGTIRLPGDKSISHRAALLSAMAVGETNIGNYGSAEDCETTLKCLAQLGVPVEKNGGTIKITGLGTKGFVRPDAPLDCGILLQL